MITGTDISYWQQTTDFAKMKQNADFTGLTAGSSYVLTATVTISGNTMSAYCEIRCDNEVAS